MIKFLFLGDISLNNSYNKFYSNDKNPFDHICKNLIKSSSCIGNLECLAEGEKGENKLKYPRLKTNVKTLNLLKNLNLEFVTLAHNHVYDNLKDGFDKTLQNLDSLDIKYLGAGTSKSLARKNLIIDKGGIKFGFLNYVTRDTNPHLPENCDVFLNFYNLKNIQNDIKKLKDQVDHIIVLNHWGGKTEDGYFPDLIQPSEARKIIEFGADLIIGGHSHTIQPYEIYKGKYIFYSLGNFCFDDIKMDDKIFQIGTQRARQSMIPEVTFTKFDYKVKIHFSKNKNGFIYLNRSKIKPLQILFRNFLFKNFLEIPTAWKIYYLYLKKIYPIKFYFFESNEGFFYQIFNLKADRVINYIFKKN